MTDQPSNCVRVGDVAYCVGRVPARKRVALYRDLGTEVQVVAYFTDEAAAEAFRAWLVGLCQAAR